MGRSTTVGETPAWHGRWAAVWLAVVVIVGIFLTEALVMLILPWWVPHAEGWTLAAYDATVLTVAILPLIYILVYRPLASELTNVRALAAANEMLHAEQRQRHAMRKDLLARVLRAQEEERLRVARELHDTVSQDLAALRLELERMEDRSAQVGLGAECVEIETRIQDVIATVRRITLNLRPQVLDRLGLVPAMRAHLQRLEGETPLRGRLVLDGEEQDLAQEQSDALFRIFQESLTNVVRHAQASHVLVTLAFHPAKTEMTIEDDGDGFDVRSLPQQRAASVDGGLGLLGIEERASALGGQVSCDSAPGEGTTIRVVLPRGQGTDDDRTAAPPPESGQRE